MNEGTMIIIGVVVLISLTEIFTYNGLIIKEQKIKQASSQIDNQLQRRLDLITKIVKTVKGYIIKEKEIFNQIADSRTKLARANTTKEKIRADSQLQSSLSKLLVIAEQYPNLKSNKNYKELITSLEYTENRITVARKDYNTSVERYNSSRARFPSNIFANLFEFKEYDYFKESEDPQSVPKIDFLANN